MRVFISWSGERGLKIAEALRDWLKTVVQASEPCCSQSDIERGTGDPGSLPTANLAASATVNVIYL